MPNNYLSVLYKHIIQVENKKLGLKVCVCVGGGGGGTNIPLPPPIKKVGGACPLAPTTTPLPTPVYIIYLIFRTLNIFLNTTKNKQQITVWRINNIGRYCKKSLFFRT